LLSLSEDGAGLLRAETEASLAYRKGAGA
jgi:hypothetical protein